MATILVPAPTETQALALVGELREASQATWASGDPRGIDVAAIESLDRRCLAIIREDGVDRRQDLSIPEPSAVALLVQLELPGSATAGTTRDQIEGAQSPDAPDSAVGRFCHLLDRLGLLDDAELAMPGDARRRDAFLALREAAPIGAPTVEWARRSGSPMCGSRRQQPT